MPRRRSAHSARSNCSASLGPIGRERRRVPHVDDGGDFVWVIVGLDNGLDGNKRMSVCSNVHGHPARWSARGVVVRKVRDLHTRRRTNPSGDAALLCWGTTFLYSHATHGQDARVTLVAG